MTLTFDPETHIYKVNEEVWPSVTQILSDMGFVDGRFFTEYARERGSLAHLIIKWDCEGVLDEDTVDPILRPYLDAWRLFVADTGFVSEQVETGLYDPIRRFAGTPDNVGELNGIDSVIDYKTSVTASPMEQLQTAGYELLTGRLLKRYSLHLTNTGKYKLIAHKDRNDRRIFIAALSCYWWKRNNGIR